MIHSYENSKENVLVRSLEKSDIEYLRKWRNDSRNTKYLRKIPYITKEQQEAWFADYIKNNGEMIFAIEETCQLKRMVGSASLYNFIGKEAEFGRFLIGDVEAHGKKIGYNAMFLILEIAFDRLELDKVVLTCFVDNVAALKVYQSLGFEEETRISTTDNSIEVFMSIKRERFINLYKGE